MSTDNFFVCFAIGLQIWPVTREDVLFSDSAGGIKFQFIGLLDGSLGLRIQRNGIYENYETDIILSEGDFKVVVSFNYAPSQPSVEIDDISIKVAPIGTRHKDVYRLPSQPTVKIQKSFELSDKIPAHATAAEALFIRTIIDLASASNTDDWYLLLKSSAHLRLLLLDGLLHKANGLHKVKVQFRVVAQGTPPPVVFDKLWHNFAPHGLPEHLLTDVSLDQFLKLLVFESKSDSITVKDVIRAAANADGGVHLDAPRQAQEELVLELDKESMRFGQAASRHILKDICSVVVTSTIPLIERIQGSP